MLCDGRPQKILVDDNRAVVAARYGNPDAERVMLFDPGSFGIYADGHHLARLLAADGWFVAAMTRAGMYGSDPLPEGQAPVPGFHVGDIAKLMNALGLSQKVILAGHSMAGVRLHLAGSLLRERLRGLALIDAVCPSLMQSLTWSGWVAWAKGVGLTGAKVVETTLGGLVDSLHPNLLHLEGQARADKLASISSGDHLRCAAREVAATERRAFSDVIAPASDMPSYFATATPVSQGTTKLLAAYGERSTWTRREHFKKDGHMSILAPPSVMKVKDGIEALWEAGEP